MNAPTNDIKDMLEERSSGYTFGSEVFIGTEPSEPANSITLYDTGGPTRLMLISQGYEYPTISIHVRSDDYNEGWAIADDIKSYLHGRANVSCNGALYTMIKATCEPTFVGQDDNGKNRFIINFDLQRRAI